MICRYFLKDKSQRHLHLQLQYFTVDFAAFKLCRQSFPSFFQILATRKPFPMEPITRLWGLVSLLAILLGGHCLDERKRILEGKIENLRARMQDLGEFLFLRIEQDNDLGHWVDEVQELVKKTECLLGQVGGWRGYITSLMMRLDVDKLVDALEAHDKKGDVLYRHAMFGARAPFRGYFLSVRALVGQVASNTVKQLELLLQDDKVGRISIHGVEGIGKTFLMKHLHNSALRRVDRFDHVYWATFPDQFTIKHVQDAVAAVVNCDLTSDDDLNVRARKLSDKLAGLVSFVLFLDGVPGVDFSLDQVGIPVPAEGSKCKLVLTTNSTLESRLLDRFEAIKVDPFPEEEAYQLFMHEANIEKGSVSYLDGIPRSLASRCCGVPRIIVNIATRMRGIDDLHEWRNALFELGRLGLKNKLPFKVVTCNSSTQV